MIEEYTATMIVPLTGKGMRALFIGRSADAFCDAFLRMPGTRAGRGYAAVRVQLIPAGAGNTFIGKGLSGGGIRGAPR
ncbi:hypothetical protein ACE0DR_07875 [Azotobacter sp. CWF10]